MKGVVKKLLSKNLPLVTGLILASAAAGTTWYALQVETPEVEVLVAQATLSVGHQVTPQDVRVEKLPADAVPPSAVRSFGEIEGTVVTGGPVMAGDVLRREHFAAVSSLTSDLMTFAPKGWVAVELPPETGMGLKGIRRGDRVAVVGVPIGNGGAVVEPALLAREAVILATPWVSAEGSPATEETGNGVRHYVVAAPPQDAAKIARAVVTGRKVTLILMPGGAEDVVRAVEQAVQGQPFATAAPK